MWIKFLNADLDALKDVKNELHIAVQIVAGFTRIFLPESRNDENASLRWDAKSLTMKGQHFGEKKNVQLALNINQFQIELLVEDIVFDQMKIEGRTVEQIVEWVADKLNSLQMNVADDITIMPYQLEGISFSKGHKFENVRTDLLEQLAACYQNASVVFKKVLHDNSKSKPTIGIWPHHFDMAFSSNENGNYTTVGMSPGDTHYDQPYFYLSIWPQPKKLNINAFKPIVGRWHTKFWLGLVLLSNDFVLENEYLEERIILDFVNNAMQIAQRVV